MHFQVESVQYVKKQDKRLLMLLLRIWHQPMNPRKVNTRFVLTLNVV